LSHRTSSHSASTRCPKLGRRPRRAALVDYGWATDDLPAARTGRGRASAGRAGARGPRRQLGALRGAPRAARAGGLPLSGRGRGEVLRDLGIDRLHDAAGRGDHAAVVAAAERIPEGERVAEAWLLLGDARAALGDTQGAAEAWRRALALEPLKGMRKRFAAVG